MHCCNNTLLHYCISLFVHFCISTFMLWLIGAILYSTLGFVPKTWPLLLVLFTASLIVVQDKRKIMLGDMFIISTRIKNWNKWCRQVLFISSQTRYSLCSSCLNGWRCWHNTKHYDGRSTNNFHHTLPPPLWVRAVIVDKFLNSEQQNMSCW